MALQSSGKISINDIKKEFSGPSAKVMLSSYYKGGGKVPNVPVNQKIPSVGKIKLSDFYGSKKTVKIAQIIKFTQTVDGSDYYDFSAINNTLTIRHRNWQSPSFPAKLEYSLLEDDVVVKNEKTSITSWTSTLPFTLLQTTNVVLEQITGRSLVSLIESSSASNNWKTTVLINDDGPRGAGTHSFKLTYTLEE